MKSIDVKSIAVKDFDLKRTVECGQIFRWDFIEGWYYITINDLILKVRQKDSRLEYAASKKISPDFVRKYFSVDINLKQINKTINKDRNIANAIKAACGLRMVRQQPFECLVSYICSAASNIPRIKRNLNALSKAFGKKIFLNNYSSYSFPEPNDFKACSSLEHSLRKCGFGFRARFFPEMMRMISEVAEEEHSNDFNKAFEFFFKKIKEMSYKDARSELMRFSGVGSKVADCVLLFSLDFTEAFPVDVWIKRVMQELYFKNKKKASNKAIEDFGREYFGKYAGYAQEYLFYWRRNNK